MKALYKAKATATGGRDSHVSSDDGTLDFNLSVPKGLGGGGGEWGRPTGAPSLGQAARRCSVAHDSWRERRG